MKETEVGDHEVEQTALCDSLPRDSQEDILAVAVSKAEELLQILGEETQVLKHFNNRKLMAILPRKEHLIRELVTRITHVKKTSGDDRNPAYIHLKGCLAEIDRVNRSNQVLVESSLAYFNDFIECICPSNYGPGQEGVSRHKSAAFKGMAFRKEI